MSGPRCIRFSAFNSNNVERIYILQDNFYFSRFNSNLKKIFAAYSPNSPAELYIPCSIAKSQVNLKQHQEDLHSLPIFLGELLQVH